jgi:predicted DNA-binding protein
MTDINELREYYDNTDVSDSIRHAVRENEIAEEVMVSTSIRLPRSLMERLREQAAIVGVPATTLMRTWVLERLNTDPHTAVISVADLERLIAEHSHPANA